jgi:ADP-ribose pyrophosphatase
MALPPLPKFVLSEVEDLSPRADEGFLRLRRRRLRLERPSMAPSDVFTFDNVDRRALDAVVVAAHFVRDRARWVYLRSSMRPALALRPLDQRPFPESDTLGALWELPAGLVEPDECSRPGLLACAARELHEEVGLQIAPSRFRPLGPATFPACGIIGERHHFFHVEVSADAPERPAGDGSVLERDAVVVAVRLDEALAEARRGAFEDAKTELGLRRLADALDAVAAEVP